MRVNDNNIYFELIIATLVLKFLNEKCEHICQRI